MDRVQAIRERLDRTLSPERIDITDDSHRHIGHAGAAAGGGHFSVRIVSEKFRDRSPIERHRLVYQAVGDMMPHEIHALSIEALTADELRLATSD